MADVLSAYQSGWRANVFIEMKQIIETLARRWDLVLSQFSIAIANSRLFSKDKMFDENL